MPNNRQVYALLAAVLTVLSPLPPGHLARARTHAQADNHRTDVIVIGAGMAGLATAKTLTDLDYHVVVLEARPRIGGRVWTDRSMGSLPLDMGASWIHGVTNNPLTALARTYGVKTVPTDAENYALYDLQRGRLNEHDEAAIDSRFARAMQEARQIAEQRQRQHAPDISVQAGLEQTPTLRQASARERTELAFSAHTALEHEFAGATSLLSLFHFDEGSTPQGGDVVFPQGYGQLAEGLANGIDIRQRHRVTAIDYRADPIVVETDQGTFQASQVVVTVPLGVLKKGSIAFTPPLPAAKQTAIQRIGVGTLNKLYLKFSRVFWPREADWLGFVGPQRGESAEFFNLARVTGQPVLLAFTAGDNGQRVEAQTDVQRVATTMTTLRAMFGQDIPEPSASLATRWTSDPFAFGSYSYLAVGSTPADRAALAEPVGRRLYFAGEATSTAWPATVHGAYLSGVAAARRLDDEADD